MYRLNFRNRKHLNPVHRIRHLLVIVLVFSCSFSGCDQPADFTTLEDILKAGEITVITRNNAHCYYHYRGQAMGFEYDLAAAFADHLGVRLKIKNAERWDAMIPSLLNGEGALLAASLTITPQRKKRVAFSEGYLKIQQHIIAHRENLGVKSVKDLSGRMVHIRKGTSYHERLQALQQEGIPLKIELKYDTPTEELIQQVAEGKIGITIADSNIAQLNRRYYPQIYIAGPIAEEEYLGWALNPNAKKLLSRINFFFKKIKQNGQFAEIYNRYYADVEIFDYVDLRIYHRRLETILPRYRPFIKQVADKYGFDWRLIAAQMYQESHFNPNARSHAGAFGLMQLTRPTAESLGLKDILNPVKNIYAGVQHLKHLYDYYGEAKDFDRLLIALAAYNVGQGHVNDARLIATRMELDPNKWSSLTKTLPLLRDKKYYKNTSYGYCRGTEPIEYTKRIMIYYDILKRQSIEFDRELFT